MQCKAINHQALQLKLFYLRKFNAITFCQFYLFIIREIEIMILYYVFLPSTKTSLKIFKLLICKFSYV